MQLLRDDFVSVHPIGERVCRWPPAGHMHRRMLYYVPVIIDEGERMTPDEAFVADDFPEKGTMIAVLPVPGGAVGYHVGHYGEFWLTDPEARDEGIKGGLFLVDDKGVRVGA